MKNILIISCIFLVLFGCSKKNNGIELFGRNIPANGITKDLPKVSREKNISSKAVSVEYQKHLDTLLENELVKVDSLQLFQNGDSYLP
ncbi:MAG: hypothetical protein PHY93_19810, partial [Bacteriovorax sp.]|nr:hypothetical protein [Bacteriovorax sp.]